MNTFLAIYNSSVGKKICVALTGLFLCVFLIVHLAGNLLLYKNDGGAAFDRYAEVLPSFLIIRIVELGLFAIFLIHILTTTILWFMNRSARPVRYTVNRPQDNSTLFSRTMFLSGSIVFIFLVIHMRTFWYSTRFHHDAYPSMYNLVVTAFSDPVYSLLYVVAMVLLAFHLQHGFESAFQTFGLKNKRYAPLIEAIGVIFWLIIPLTFASMPVYFLLHS